MAVGLYLDHHLEGGIARALRKRGVDVLTAAEDGAAQWPDEAILSRATALSRAVVTCDDDFLKLAAEWQRGSRPFSAVVFFRHRRVGFGQVVGDLEVLAFCLEAADLSSAVYHLPLR